MFKYFGASYAITILGILTAYFWGEHTHAGNGLTSIFIALVLAILEISLSFDNAVVNAMKLEKMTKKWQHRFITWGIVIAVFGMRFLFPLLVVSIFANINILQVLNMALNDVNSYTHYLQLTHSSIVTFGGAFLLMLFLNYFISPKEVHWLKPIEHPMQKLNKILFFPIVLVLIILGLLMIKIPQTDRISVFLSGCAGIIIYEGINKFSKFLENKENNKSNNTHLMKYTGLVSFLYLELIDASFSLDGVLGAFALSNDIIIITIGLFIGAMFVRSLTLLLVDKKTLKEFIYLEHGAHWAIGCLAILMFISTFIEVPEVVTGLTGLVFIISSLVSSIIEGNRNKEM